LPDFVIAPLQFCEVRVSARRHIPCSSAAVRIAAAATSWLILLSTLSVTAQSNVEPLVTAGWQAIEKRAGDQAAALFAQALSIRPADPALMFGAAVAAQLQGRSRDAAAYLRSAIQIDPALTPASAFLGELQYHDGDLDQAIRTYEAALSHDPANGALKERLASWKAEAAAYRGYRTYKDDRFAVMFEGPAEHQLATHAVEVLRAQFWRIGTAIGTYPSHPINVILYTEQQFRDITGAPEWSRGRFDGQIRIPVRGAMQQAGRLDYVLTHELTHAMLQSVASRNLPAWLNEGLAMHFAGDDPQPAERALTTAGVFVPLSQLQTSFSNLSRAEATVAYAQSLFVTKALLARTAGTRGLPQLLHDLDTGQTMEAALRRLGIGLGEFEAGLARRVGASRE
jgi:tetratricopeptide (TPR) repeat protein